METTSAPAQDSTPGGTSSIDKVANSLLHHIRDTELYLSQDLGNFYGPSARMPTVPKAVTDYFNDAENRTNDPMALEKLAKARELTETAYLNQRQYINKYIDSQSRKASIQFSIQLLKKATTGINQILSSN
ncbi:hypothetical protein [uncultured Roseibium sp.]|uniref:hypothetical protein n=1 Tax=uncultured Roseibium sp. TaxID=1936171 RepID=UPI0026061651|nr:hypothetical protein [uncultured Roseibium sp.]